MSRVNLDHFSAVFCFETTGASAGATGTDLAADTFGQVLQRAQKEANSQPESAEAARTAEGDRPSQSAAASPVRSQPSQGEQMSTSKKQGDEEPSAPQTADDSPETEEAVSETGDPSKEDTDGDHSDAEEEAEDPLAVVVAMQTQAESTPAPVDELVLSGGIASIIATDATSGCSGPSLSAASAEPSIVSMLTDSPANSAAVPTENHPAAKGELAGELAGEIVEMIGDRTEFQPASSPAAKTAKEAAKAAVPGAETKIVSSEADAPADGQPAPAEAAAVAATATDGSSGENGQSRGGMEANARRAQDEFKARTPSKVASPSASPDETMITLEPDPTAELLDGKTDHADAGGDTATTKGTAGEARPSVLDANASPSVTASQGTGAGDSTGGPVDRVRFIQRVVRAFESAAGDGGSVRLRLSPPELGSLRLELTLRNGVMNAHVEAETSAARTLLLDNLPALRERLAEQNIKVEQFDVDLADQGTSNSWQQPYDRQDAEPRRAEDDSRLRGRRESTVENTTAARPAPRYGPGGGFDVTI